MGKDAEKALNQLQTNETDTDINNQSSESQSLLQKDTLLPRINSLNQLKLCDKDKLVGAVIPEIAFTTEGSKDVEKRVETEIPLLSDSTIKTVNDNGCGDSKDAEISVDTEITFLSDNNNTENGGGPNSIETNDIVKKAPRTGWRRYVGIMLAFQASLLFPLGGLIVKALPEYHPFSFTFWRFQGILLPALPMAIYYRCVKKEEIFSTVWPPQGKGRTWAFLVLRCAVGATAVVFQFYSLKFISMADSSVISFSTPVLVAIAGHFCLDEKFGVIPILSGLLTMIGVIVITRPPLLTGAEEFDNNNLIGVVLALCSMVCATATFVVLRHLRKLHFAMLNMFFGTWGTLEALLLSAIIWRFQLPEGQLHWMLGIALAALSFVTQTSMTLSFKFEQAATISLIRTCDVVFAFGWQFLILGVVPDQFSVIGAVVVITGILLVGFRKWLSELPPEDRRKDTFWILLK